MAFGMPETATADFADRVQYDANAGRMFRIDFDMATGEKTPVDITMPPPQFAVDFGSLEIGYGHYSATGPEFHLVPEGQPPPAQPRELDEKGRPKFRQVFRLKLYGKVLGGLREWSSAAKCVLHQIEELYTQFKAAPEAAQGRIPIVTMTKTLPVTMGKGQRQRTVYAPCLVITGWTDRVEAMGPRTVPAPKPNGGTTVKKPPSNMSPIDGDEIPF
jgi:hypothetical protein